MGWTGLWGLYAKDTTVREGGVVGRDDRIGAGNDGLGLGMTGRAVGMTVVYWASHVEGEGIAMYKGSLLRIG